MIFGEHYYRFVFTLLRITMKFIALKPFTQFYDSSSRLVFRTVISAIWAGPASMVVHAHILLDPDRYNLYHSSKIW